jgi:hypothetical protein
MLVPMRIPGLYPRRLGAQPQTAGPYPGTPRRVLPGPLGELAARELLAHAELGYFGAPDALVPQLARQVLALAAPSLPAASSP